MRGKTIVIGTLVVALLIVAAPVAASSPPTRQFAKLARDFDRFAGEIDRFVVAVLRHPGEFGERFAKLATDLQDWVQGFDDRVAKLQAKVAGGTPVSVSFGISCGDSEVLFSDDQGDMVLRTPCSFTDTFDIGFSGIEAGPVWDVFQGSTGEDIFLAVTHLDATVNGEPGGIPDRFAGTCIVTSCLETFLGRWFMTGGTGSLATFHVAGPFIPGLAWGLAFWA